MLNSALAIAHIEDLHRAAARGRMLRLAHRVAHERRVAATPNGILRTASSRPGDAVAPQADGMTPSEIPQAAPGLAELPSTDDLAA